VRWWPPQRTAGATDVFNHDRAEQRSKLVGQRTADGVICTTRRKRNYEPGWRSIDLRPAAGDIGQHDSARNNKPIRAGAVLFEIDPTQFQYQSLGVIGLIIAIPPAALLVVPASVQTRAEANRRVRSPCRRARRTGRTGEPEPVCP
jgi:hypothetical protein